MIVADIDAQKRAQARQMGAVATIDNAAPDAVKQVIARSRKTLAEPVRDDLAKTKNLVRTPDGSYSGL